MSGILSLYKQEHEELIKARRSTINGIGQTAWAKQEEIERKKRQISLQISSCSYYLPVFTKYCGGVSIGTSVYKTENALRTMHPDAVGYVSFMIGPSVIVLDK